MGDWLFWTALLGWCVGVWLLERRRARFNKLLIKHMGEWVLFAGALANEVSAQKVHEAKAMMARHVEELHAAARFP